MASIERMVIMLFHLCDAVEGGELAHALLEVVPVDASTNCDDCYRCDDVKCLAHCVALSFSQCVYSI